MTKKVKTNEPGVNTLVRHKKLTTLGIGCISKVHPKHYTVNWELNDSNKCLKTAVEEVGHYEDGRYPNKEYKGFIWKYLDYGL